MRAKGQGPPMVRVAGRRLRAGALEPRRRSGSTDRPALEDLVEMTVGADQERDAKEARAVADRIAAARAIRLRVRAVLAEAWRGGWPPPQRAPGERGSERDDGNAMGRCHRVSAWTRIRWPSWSSTMPFSKICSITAPLSSAWPSKYLRPLRYTIRSFGSAAQTSKSILNAASPSSGWVGGAGAADTSGDGAWCRRPRCEGCAGNGSGALASAGVVDRGWAGGAAPAGAGGATAGGVPPSPERVRPASSAGFVSGGRVAAADAGPTGAGGAATGGASAFSTAAGRGPNIARPHGRVTTKAAPITIPRALMTSATLTSHGQSGRRVGATGGAGTCPTVAPPACRGAPAGPRALEPDTASASRAAACTVG